MKRTIYLLIMLAVTGAIWIAEAQQERRDRDRDRDRSRERDRNGEQRSRDRERDRSAERRIEPSTNAAPANVERETAPAVETISTNTGPVDPMSYDAFRIIAQRNIFDPNRRARTTSSEAPSERPKRTEAFTLLGSIAYEKGDFAFFEGSSSEYRKSVKAGDSIGGLKVAEVAPNHVKFEAGEGKTLQLPIGSQMKRVEGEEWKVNSQVESFSSSSGSGSSSSAESTNSAAPSGSGEVSEVLKRLMEKAKKGE